MTSAPIIARYPRSPWVLACGLLSICAFTFLLGFWLMSELPGATVHAAVTTPRIVRVVTDSVYAPYSFLSDDGKGEGIVMDQWLAWERKTKIKVEIQAMNLGEALRRMRAGDFDVIDTVVETPERRSYFDFTPPYATVETPIFFRKDISGIAGIASLTGFPVAVKTGDQHIDQLKAQGITTLITFPNYAAIIEAAKQRKVNVFVADAPSALYLLNKAGIEDDFRQSAPIFRDELRRAVRKGDATMLHAVMEGFATISPGELQQIDDKWFGRTINEHKRYLAYASYTAATLILLVLGLIGWNHSLRKGILQRTVALSESDVRLDQIAKNIREVFWMTTPTMDKLYYASPGYESIWGRSLDSLRQWPNSFMDLIHPEDCERVIGIFSSAQREHGFDVEYRIVRPEGSARWIRDRGFPVKDQDGKVYRMAGLAEDITERKKAEDTLQCAATELQALSQRLVEVQESDRKELARELHDRVGQNLTALRINLTILEPVLVSHGSDADRARITDSEALLESTMDTIENVMSDLRPPMLDDHGLVAALNWQATTFSRRTGISTTVRTSGWDVRPIPNVELALFRIAQEALNNIAKHAAAQQVEIALEHANGRYVMSVKDDGVGFDNSKDEAARKFKLRLGIVTMRERSQAVGGQFEVHALPDRGTQLTVRVPL